MCSQSITVLVCEREGREKGRKRERERVIRMRKVGGGEESTRRSNSYTRVHQKATGAGPHGEGQRASRTSYHRDTWVGSN
jgi:hypothetical protein